MQYSIKCQFSAHPSNKKNELKGKVELIYTILNTISNELFLYDIFQTMCAKPNIELNTTAHTGYGT